MPTIITQNTIWNAGETYNLADDVQIADGATLTIQPGAIVNGNGHRIQTFGKLIANGTATSKVTFNNTDFVFSSNYADPGEIQISFATLAGGTFLPATGNGSYGKFNVTDSTIAGGNMMYIWYPVADSSFERNVFINAGTISVGTHTGEQVIISNNTFYSTRNSSSIADWAAYGRPLLITGNNFYVSGTAIESELGYEPAKVSASGNYFGASTSSEISAKILDRTDDLTRAATVDINAQRFTPVTSAPSLPSGELAEMLTLNILRQGKGTAAYNSVLAIANSATSQAAAIDSVVKLADLTTSVATLSYQFFTGKIPSLAGLNYLVSTSGPNPNNINSAYYQLFSMENRYINFAVNLGRDGEGKAPFTAKYGSLSLFDATREAYKTIFGSTPTDAKIHALIDNRIDYFAYYGKDGAEGIGTKAAMVGWLLAEAEKADLGSFAKANAALLADLSDGATLAIDLIGIYWKPEYAYLG